MSLTVRGVYGWGVGGSGRRRECAVVGVPKHLQPVREEYLEWLLLDKRTRQVHNLPRSQAEFARVKGLADRTLRRWQGEPEFQERLAQRRGEMERAGRGGAVKPQVVTSGSRPASDPRDGRVRGAVRDDDPLEAVDRVHESLVAEARSAGLSEDEADYLSIKGAIRDAAGEGDARALELYMKYWGNELAQRERERAESRFPDMSEGEIADAVLSLLPVQVVSGWLERNG